MLTLLGPSGCGKSTLMRIVAGFEKATSGDVVIDGRRVNDTPPEKRPVNMVFQRYALFPHLDVFDNVAFGLRLKKLPKQEITDATQRILDLVQLSDLADRWIGEISGGQAQRVALARALVNEPTVLLLDEPLAALDLKIRHYMIGELKRIHETTGTTFLYVTHDQDEAMMLSDRIVLMNEGRIEQIGTPEEMYSAPKTLFTARFLGETNIVPATFARRDGEVSVYDTAGRAHRVRPRDGAVGPLQHPVGPAGGAVHRSRRTHRGRSERRQGQGRGDDVHRQPHSLHRAGERRSVPAMPGAQACGRGPFRYRRCRHPAMGQRRRRRPFGSVVAARRAR